MSDKEEIMRRAGKNDDGLVMAGILTSMAFIIGPTMGALVDPELDFIVSIPFIILGLIIGGLTKNVMILYMKNLKI